MTTITPETLAELKRLLASRKARAEKRLSLSYIPKEGRVDPEHIIELCNHLGALIEGYKALARQRADDQALIFNQETELVTLRRQLAEARAEIERLRGEIDEFRHDHGYEKREW